MILDIRTIVCTQVKGLDCLIFCKTLCLCRYVCGSLLRVVSYFFLSNKTVEFGIDISTEIDIVFVSVWTERTTTATSIASNVSIENVRIIYRLVKKGKLEVAARNLFSVGLCQPHQIIYEQMPQCSLRQNKKQKTKNQYITTLTSNILLYYHFIQT